MDSFALLGILSSNWLIRWAEFVSGVQPINSELFMHEMDSMRISSRPILVVEDERALADSLCAYLHFEGFSTARLERGDDVFRWLDRYTPALLLLDQTLPGKVGLDVCKEIRRHSNIPIIMVSTRVDEIDRLLGLEHGADDYICKPYSPREVVARVKTVLRRCVNVQNEPPLSKRPCLQFDDDAWRAMLAGCDLQLTAIEYRLLRFLARVMGCLLTRTQLINELYQDGRVISDRTIDSHIRKLRRKMGDMLPGFDPIKTIYGMGYRFVGEGLLIRGCA